jgi:HEAT repeat protein
VCQKALPKPNGSRPAGEGAAWWLGGSPPPEGGAAAPASHSTPRLDLPPAAAPAPAPYEFVRKEPAPHPEPAPEPAPAPTPAGEPGPWAGLAILFGLVGFGVACAPRFGVFGLAIAGLGLLLGLLGALVRRRHAALALAGAALCLQATLFAGGVHLGYVRLPWTPSPETDPDKQPPKATEPYLQALKSKDAEERVKAVASLTDMARGMNVAVPALAERMRNDDSPDVRRACAEALGHLGPLASSAYGDLVYVQQKDHSRSVQDAAKVALESVSKQTLTTEQLVKAFKSADAEERNKAVAALADMARGVADAVPALTDRLLNDDDARVRAGFATALGNLGPQARPAYPALKHAEHNDTDKLVQQEARTATDKIGMPGPYDVPFIVRGLQDPRTAYRASVAQTLSWVCTPENKSAVPLLKEALVDPDPRVKVFAAQALWAVTHQPNEVLPTFRDMLHYQDDRGVRAEAARFLALLGAEARGARTDLRKALGDDEIQVQLYAAQALWQLDPEKETADLVAPVLGKLLKTKDPAYRADAAQVLVNLGPRASPAIADLTDALKDKTNDPDTRARCAFALGNIGSVGQQSTDAATVKVLTEVLKTGGGALSEHAAFALKLLGPKAVAAWPELTAALKDPNVQLRGRAALALAAIGEGAKEAVPALTQALADNTDPNIRVFLAQALWFVAKDQATALPVLLDIIQDGKLRPDIKGPAANVLAYMGPAARAAQPALARLQDDPDEALRAAVAVAIDRIGPVTADDVPALLKGLDSTNLTHRRAAAQTLFGAASNGEDVKSAVPSLQRAFGDKDQLLRLAAAEALGAIGPDAKTVVPDLVKALEQDNVELKAAALDALRGIGPEAKTVSKDVVTQVLARVTDKDPMVRAAALEAAVGLSERDPDVVKALEGRLKDDDPRIRVVAADIHRHLKKKPEVVLPVLTAVLFESKAEVKIAAIAVLGDMGPDAKEAMARITELTKDPDAGVRRAATEALKKIGPQPN